MKLSDLVLIPPLLCMPLAINSVALLSSPILLTYSIFKTLIGNPLAKLQENMRAKSLKPILEENKNYNVVVIGCGFSGIHVAIELKKLGISCTVFEKSSAVGGTWWDNKYPGCECDVPAHLYAYSFAPNPNWSASYVSAAEIQQYLQDVVNKFGINDNIQLNTNVDDCIWDENSKTWKIKTSKGNVVANVVFSCVGALSIPTMPNVDGLSSFKGKSFHSSAWDQTFDATNKTVAVIGSAASAIQLVPCLAKIAKKVVIFQRTPSYIVAKPVYKFSPFVKKLFATLPFIHRFFRLYLYVRAETLFFLFLRGKSTFFNWLAVQGFRLQVQGGIQDPELRAKVLPDYAVGCKRILLTNEWFPTLNRPNVQLVNAALQKVESDGVVAAQTKYNVDAIVYATGFNPMSFTSIKVIGRNNTNATDLGTEIPTLHGVTVPNFPNFFVMLGPNTGLGHNSVVWMVECQVNYAVKCLEMMLKKKIAAMEPKKEAAEKFKTKISKELSTRVWSSGCKSWYMNDKGFVYALWPGPTFTYWYSILNVDASNYRLDAK